MVGSIAQFLVKFFDSMFKLEISIGWRYFQLDYKPVHLVDDDAELDL